MKYDISELLDGYMEGRVDLTGTTPLSKRRIKARTMGMLKQKNRGRQRPSYARIRLLRGLLIAAVAGALCCATAFAVITSLREIAREDMGVSPTAPIPEWTEYENGGKGGETGPGVELTATLCVGERIYAYLEATPVAADVAEALAEHAPEYEWWPGDITLSTCSALLEQVGYDTETQTALVKVSLRSQELEETEAVGLTLQLRHDGRTEQTYGVVTIPITENQTIGCGVDIPVTNTTDHLTSNLHPEDVPLILDYEMEGRITQLAVSAGYLEVVLEAPNATEWLAVSGAGQIQGNSRGLPPEIQEWFLRGLYQKSWCVGVNEALEGMTLDLQDGTSVAVEDLAGDGAGGWSAAGSGAALMDDGTQQYQFVVPQALDLSAIRSVTVDGIAYFFPTADGVSG